MRIGSRGRRGGHEGKISDNTMMGYKLGVTFILKYGECMD
jgi:hypothetical protein